MKIKTGRKYELNKRIKEEVDKKQTDYRESDDDEIRFIKRVYVYITDKKGNILNDVKITLGDKEIIVSRYGLLISQFPNEETEISASKEGYKDVSTNIILDATIQTHEFYLALENSDEESEVISTDNTSDGDESSDERFVFGEVLFEPPLDGTDEITSWSGNNSTYDGIYSAHGSFLTDDWSNEGLWQLDFDVAYSGSSLGYIGIMPICSTEIKPFTDEKGKNYALTAWEGMACLTGLNVKVEGPINYKYTSRMSYHHGTLKKVAEDKLEYYFDDNVWYLTTDKLQNLSKLHIGGRDNPFDRDGGQNILYKNIKVVELIKVNSLNEGNQNPSQEPGINQNPSQEPEVNQNPSQEPEGNNEPKEEPSP